MAKEPVLSLKEVNERISKLKHNQLRILIVLMATGQDFTQAFEVAITYPGIDDPVTE